MSARAPETSIYTTDAPEVVKRKIWNAYTGGRASIAEQKKLGGNPNICTVFQYLFCLFEEDDQKLVERERNCKTGDILCGYCKTELTEKVNNFLTIHQRKREKAKNMLDKFHIKRE